MKNLKLLEKLGLSFSNDKELVSNSKLGRALAEALGSTGEKHIRYIAAFGGLLGRVANSDGYISSEETARIQAILAQFTDLKEGETELVKQIIHEQTKTLSGIENHIYTNELNELLKHNKKLEVLSCLFAVAAADDEISAQENDSIRVISKALLIPHSDFINIRHLYKDKLSVIQNLKNITTKN